MKASVLSVGVLIVWVLAVPARPAGREKAPGRPADAAATAARKARLRAELKRLPYRIVYESYRGKDWELFVMGADGSGCINLTRSPDVDEMYPHASPDGSKIAFVADEGKGRSKVRNVYYVRTDLLAAGAEGRPGGPDRKLVARNARHPCWSPDGKAVAYTPNEYPRFTYDSYATRYICIYDLATGRHRKHPNPYIHHLYALKWSPDGKWFLATVHGGMGYRYGDLAIEVEGNRVFQLKGVEGCRPDVRPDGKKLLWNLSDTVIAVADLDLTSTPPKVTNGRKLIRCSEDCEVYHGDWSPDGKYIAFAHGPKGPQYVGGVAKGWHIYVADASEANLCVRLTTDGVSNKEPDWLPAGGENRKPKGLGPR